MIKGIIESIIAAVIIAIVVGVYRCVVGQRIKIISPQQNGFLATAETRFGVVAHPVHGTLKHLPKGHKIWLLVIDEKTGKTWPQGFASVEFSKEQGTWSGYINVWGWQNVTVAAVVAPPTSQEYFNYFQRVGSKTNHEPILGIPAECKHRDLVQVKVPKV